MQTSYIKENMWPVLNMGSV